MLRKIISRPEFALFILLSVFLLPLCGLVFQCGCTHLWAGADSHCNIHVPGKPDCPWCVTPFHDQTLSLITQMIPFVVIFLSAAISSRFSRKWLGASYVKQLIAGIIGGMLTLILLAFIYAKIYKYP
ncbi:MAG TPA: hypothetical protein VLH08_10895 [Acidobacteriota bacterium]|nr:hypothetical protein [Acidobacteriota bacterium]